MTTNKISHAPSTSTKVLLIGGILAGPIYILLGLFQILIRTGFDPTRHDLSLMSNGHLGWIQIDNFLLTGLLVIGAAIGLRRTLRGSKSSTWAPLLLGLYGLGLMGAGLFVADPMNGFPLGTPMGAPAHPTMHGTLHIITGAFGFLGLILACFVLAKYFASLKQRGWMKYSIFTGVVFLAGFFGIAAGSQQKGTALQIVTLAFTAAVVLAWSWITAVCIKFKNQS